MADFLELSEFEQRTLYAFSILGAIDLRVEPLLTLRVAAPEEKSPEEFPEEAAELELVDIIPEEPTVQKAARPVV